MKKIALLFILVSNFAFSQGINDYQYVVVPQKFSIFKEDNKFNLNNSVKLLLQKYGFKAFLATDTLPFEIVNSNCNKLHADLEKESNMFSTKVKVVLKDCFEKVVYQTAYGKSDEKDLAKAFNQALRDAATSFESLEYKYNGKNGASVEATPIHSQEPVVQQNSANSNTTTSNSNDAFYFAQPTANGFQVVNSEPRVILRLFYTSQKDVFMAIMANINGVVINKDGKWFFEFYENNKLKSEPLNLKF